MMSNWDDIPIQTINDMNRMSNWDETLKEVIVIVDVISTVQNLVFVMKTIFQHC